MGQEKLVPSFRWKCSFTKVILLLFMFLFISFLCIRYTNAPSFSNIKSQNSKDRTLKIAKGFNNDPSTSTKNNEQEFIEVFREQPKLSYSLSSSLDKYLAEERKKHNPSQNENSKETQNHPVIGEGEPVPSNQANVISLKSALKDPAFVNRIQNLEDRRQDIYIKMLKKRGQLVENEDGSQTIVSYPKTPVKFPNNLKKNLDDWSLKERIWLNITHFPWPTDEDCKHYSVQFAKPGIIPIIGLASYPSSGNTWLRYLIEGVTGYYTGSMYNDISIRKKGYYGEGVPADAGIVLTVKTHGHTVGKAVQMDRQEQIKENHHNEVNHTAILLIRNPYKAIIGHRNLDAGGHTGFAKEDQFKGPGWQSFVEIKIRSWLNHYSDWLENNPRENLMVLHYEHIQQNLRHSLRRIAEFLGFKEDQGRIECAYQHSTGYFKRNHKKENVPNPFTRKQTDLIKDSIFKLNDILLKYQKETLPLELYEYYDA